jgi:hypothetical protein
MHKESVIINRNTLLHVSTLLGHLQGELFVIVTPGCTLQLSENVLLTVYCVVSGGVNCLRSGLQAHLLPYIASGAYSKWRQRLRATQFRATAILLLVLAHVRHTLLNFVKICQMTQTLDSGNATPPFSSQGRKIE